MILILLTIILPLLGGACIPLIPFKSRKARAWYVEIITIATSLLAVALMVVRPQGTLLQMTDVFTLAFHVDGPSMVFTGLIAFLWPLATLYAFEYMQHEERENSFFCFYTISFGVTLAISMAANLFTLYVFYECLTLATLPLVTHKKDTKSIYAGRKYLYYSISGAALAFIGLLFLSYYGTGGDFQLGGILDMAKVAGNETLLLGIFVLSFIGFSVKAAMFPVYAWLPAASVAPTPVTALLHAVAVVNAGAYAVIRLVYYAFGTTFVFGTWAQTIVLALTAFTIVFGSAMAVKEQHFKRRLAYSTVSNLSYILLGAALMTPSGMAGSLTHMVFHGLMKITLFYCSGAVLVKTNQKYVQDLRGFGKIMPFTFGIFTFASLALIGIPPLCGFISKWNLMSAAAETGLTMGTVAIWALVISAILTALYLMWIVISAYFLPMNKDLAVKLKGNFDPSWQMKVPLAVISLAMLILGFMGTPITRWLLDMANGLI